MKRRHFVLGSLAAAGALTAPAVTTFAQTTTGAAGSPVYNSAGEQVAAISVTNIELPMTAFAEFSEPDEGMQYATVTFHFSNTGSGEFQIDPGNLQLVDAMGRSADDVFSDPREEVEGQAMVPYLQTNTLYAGNEVDLAMTYMVPMDFTPAALYHVYRDATTIINPIALPGTGDAPADATPVM